METQSEEPINRVSQARQKLKTNTFLTLISVKHLLRAIKDKPMTQPEIIEATGLCNSTVSRWLRVLHTRPNLVYIESWRRVGSRGNWSAVWSAGFYCQDALKPAPLTNAQYTKRWRTNNAKKARISTPSQGVIRHVIK
jgi:hypothetical protein